jgi:Protein of unknown function (DUF2490)
MKKTRAWWMMVMMIRGFRTILIHFVLLFVTAGMSLYAQQKDFQSWYEVQVKTALKNGINVSGELEQRFKNNSLQYDRTLLTLAASYDPLDYLGVGGGVRFLMASDKEGVISPRYRVHANATGKYVIGGVDLSLRVRFQYGFEDFLYFTEIRDNVFANRNKLKVAYHLYGTRIDLFVSTETWGLFNNLDGRFFKKIRYSAGASYNLNFQSELSLRYILEDEFNRTNPLQSHILVLGYSYKL